MNAAHKNIILAGAGPIGMACALLAHHQGLTVHWVSPSATPADSRLLALSPRSVHYLQRLGVWARVATKDRANIQHVDIRRKEQKILTLSAHDYQLPAVGYALSMTALMQAFQAELHYRGVLFHEGWSVDSWSENHLPNDDRLTCVLNHSQEDSITELASLLIMASGSPTKGSIHVSPAEFPVKPKNLRDWWRQADITPWSLLLPKLADSDGIVRYGYGLSGFMANIYHPSLAPDKAIECFTSDGVVAVIPGGEGVFKAIVLKDNINNDSISSPSAEVFIQWLAEALSMPVTQFSLQTSIQPFQPLLIYRQSMVDGHVVWLGNAMHTVSPVGGQGFNLGLHEAWALFEMLAQEGVSSTSLQKFAHANHAETMSTLAATHALTSAHHLPPVILETASRIANHVPWMSRGIGARLMFGRRAWLAGILRL